VDERADVFRLGAILAVILTGQPPYVGKDTESVRLMAIRGQLADCMARLDTYGAEPDLVALAKRCLAFAPEDRPQDAGEVAKAVAGLRAAAEDRARRAEVETAAATARAAEQKRKRRWQVGAAAAVAAALLAAVGGLAAFLSAQARAYADLRVANDRERERFELATAAVKTFHARVSEDLLLREKGFEGLRKKLLGEAAEFYRRLEQLLQGQSDPASRAALAEAFFQLGEVTGQVGSKPEALAVHRRALSGGNWRPPSRVRRPGRTRPGA
jgi:hypothetical protein